MSNGLQPLRHRRAGSSQTKSRAFSGLESLESRTMLSATPQVNFSNFSSISGLITNGFGSTAVQSGNEIALTTGVNNQGRSVWWHKRVPITHFTTSFSFKADSTNNFADGLTFTIQNSSTHALGTAGRFLGYTGIPKSVGVGFNLWNLGGQGSQFGFLSNGATPATNTSMGQIDLHSGHTFNATLTYNGSTLSLTLKDASDSTKTFSASEHVNIAQAVGSNTAIVGFTAATGQHHSIQDLTRWTYSGGDAPTVARQAIASPDHVGGTTTQLSVIGGNTTGESNLKYTWATIDQPDDATAPTFSANGKNSAKKVTATFHKAGHYKFRVTITNEFGLSVMSAVSVLVRQTATGLRIEPHQQIVHTGDVLQFSARIADQFDDPMPTQPTFTYFVQSGPGTIDHLTGIYTANGKPDHIVIEAVGGGYAGVSGNTLLA